MSEPTPLAIETSESLWACFACGRAQRTRHPKNATDEQVQALAKHQHTVRQRGRGGRKSSRCAFDTASVRITRHVEGTKLVGFEVPV